METSRNSFETNIHMPIESPLLFRPQLLFCSFKLCSVLAVSTPTWEFWVVWHETFLWRSLRESLRIHFLGSNIQQFFGMKFCHNNLCCRHQTFSMYSTFWWHTDIDFTDLLMNAMHHKYIKDQIVADGGIYTDCTQTFTMDRTYCLAQNRWIS